MELMVATALSAVVMLGVVVVATQMVHFQVDETHKGRVSGWTLLALNRMTKELEGASVLDQPTTTTGGDIVSGCSNYSKLSNLPIDANQPNTSFYYCVNSNNLYRYETQTAAGIPIVCPMALPPSAASCGVTGAYELIAKDVYRLDKLTSNATPYFRRADEVGGVELRYIVGNPVRAPNIQTFQFI